MTEQELQEMQEFIQKLKTATPVEFTEWLKAHVHNGNDFPKVSYNDLKDIPAATVPSQLEKSFVLGENLLANDAVMLASGTMVTNTISQTTNNSNADIYGANWYGQTFQTSSTAVKIMGVKLKLKKNGSPGSVGHVFIFETASGLPSGVALVDHQVTPASITANANEYTFTFSSPVSVSPSTTYAIVFAYVNADSTNNIEWYFNSSSVYANGTYVSSTDTGSSWAADSNKDFYFKVMECQHTAGRIYKTDSSEDTELAENFIGFVSAAGSAGETGTVKVGGVVTGFSGLTKGYPYYLSTASGEISTTKAYPRMVGFAISDTEILITNDIVEPIVTQASDLLKTSADTEASYTSSGSYSKKKEIQVYMTGTYRVTFEVAGNADFTAYGRVYKNDVAYGTEQSVAAPSSSFQSFSEDLFFYAGDKVQLYTKSTNGFTVSQRNFRLSYTRYLPDGDNVITN